MENENKIGCGKRFWGKIKGINMNHECGDLGHKGFIVLCPKCQYSFPEKTVVEDKQSIDNSNPQFNLKSKGFEHKYGTTLFHGRDVKEFIQLLKEDMKWDFEDPNGFSLTMLNERIDKLSGFSSNTNGGKE